MPTWDPQQYLKFARERTRPSQELLSRVTIEVPHRVIDLGCGPGNSTTLLHKRWPKADIVGLDNSKDMLAKAAKDHPFWNWVEADLNTWTAEKPYDVVFSNAVFHWLPNHAECFPRLIQQVAPGGVLAIQMPNIRNSAAHRIITEAAEAPDWRARLSKAAQSLFIETPANYYDYFQPFAQNIDIWETEYQHVMPDAQAILEWIKGTGMRPFLDALASDEDRTKFEEHCLRGFVEAYPLRKGGSILFPYRRMFMVVSR